MLLACAAVHPGNVLARDRSQAGFTAATWLHGRWLEGSSAVELDRLAARLRELGVTTVFPNVAHGSVQPIPGGDGRGGWLPRPESARAFVDGLRERVPGIRVVPYKGYVGCSWLSDPGRRAEQVDAMVATAEAVGADGFQLDMECATVDGRHEEEFRELLVEIAAALGPQRTFSVAIPILSQEAADFADPRYADAPWLASHTSLESPRDPSRLPRVFEAVFEHADQVAIMLYDTWYLDPQADQYVQLVAGQTWAGAWFAQQHGTPEFLAGLRFSTHDEGREGGGVYHRHEVENPLSAWEGISAVLERPVADGVAVRDRLTGLAAFRLDLELAPGQPSSEGQRYLDGLAAALAGMGVTSIPAPDLPQPPERPTFPDPLER